MRMRGGCICSVELAEIYDANKEADLEKAQSLLPGAEVWPDNGIIMFRFGPDDDDAWFGQITRRDPQWFTKR